MPNEILHRWLMMRSFILYKPLIVLIKTIFSKMNSLIYYPIVLLTIIKFQVEASSKYILSYWIMFHYLQHIFLKFPQLNSKFAPSYFQNIHWLQIEGTASMLMEVLLQTVITIKFRRLLAANLTVRIKNRA